jgi:acyl-CoA thioesterase I
MFMKSLAISLALACLPWGIAPVSAAEPVRIVAIGDSITAGGRAGVKEYTYRVPLQRMLKDENACFDFVGARRGGLDAQATWPKDTAADAENEGYYGARTAEVRDRLAGDVLKFPPADIALVHLGTNDANGYVEDDIVRPMKQIIGLLRERSPGVTVLVAKIKGRRDFRTAYLHWRMSQIASSLSTPQSRIVAVDQYSDWDTAEDTFDGVHPNLKGQRKMAERWLEAMKPYLRFSGDQC